MQSCVEWLNLATHVNRMDDSDCQNPETWDKLIQCMILHEKDKEKEIEDYWEKRNKYNEEIKHVVQCEFIFLQKKFVHTKEVKEIIMMSSYSAKTNLSDTSDIDIGIIIDHMDEKNSTQIGEILISIGYKYTKFINEYYCYNQWIQCESNGQKIEIEIEIKIRDWDKSKLMIKLHDYLDNHCEEKQKKIFTYLKYRFMLLIKDFPNAYTFIKKIFYNRALLKIDPKCKFFIHNM